MLWVNLHAGFVLGLMLGGAFVAAEGLRWLCMAGERSAARTSAAYFALTTAACFLGSLLNPYGFTEHKHIAAYLHDPYLYKYVMEFQSMSFHHPLAIALEFMIVLAGIAAYRELRRKQFTYPVLLACWAHLALVSTRNIPIFMIVAAPIVARHVAEMLSSLADAPVAEWIRRSVSSRTCLPPTWTRPIGSVDCIWRAWPP